VTPGDSGPTIAGRTGGWTMPPSAERISGPSQATVGAAVALFVGAIGAAAWFWSAQHGDTPVTVAAVEAPAAPPPKPAAPSEAPVARVAAVPAPVSEPVGVAAVKSEPAKKPAAEPKKPAAEPKKAVAEAKKPEPSKAPPKKPEPVVAAAPRKPDAPVKPAASAEEDAPVDPRLEDVPPAGKAAPAAEAEKPTEKADPLAGAKRALRDGKFDEADRAVQAALAKSPDDAEAQTLRKHIETARDGIARGRTAFDKADCVGALEALEPVLQVAPKASAAQQIVASCREALPPRQL
jgi:hypothetical protein